MKKAVSAFIIGLAIAYASSASACFVWDKRDGAFRPDYAPTIPVDIF